MKKIASIFIISILFSCGYKKPYPNKISDFRPELQIKIKKIVKENHLYSIDTVAENFLKNNCSKEELLKLLECESPLLRVIAYRIIVNRNEKDYFEILLKHLSDTAKISWSSNDLVGYPMVSDLHISEVADIGKLTKNQKDILVDSVLLKHSYLENFLYMMTEIEPKERYYSLIKGLTKKKDKYPCGTQLGACIALSKFNKNEDLKFLDSIFQKYISYCGSSIFKSIEQNPNQIYYPILKKYFNKTIKNKRNDCDIDFKYYCRAVASYKTKESLSLLTELLNKSYCPENCYYDLYRDHIFRAIYKYNNPVYEDLFVKLKPKISKYVIDHLDKPDYSERKTWR